MFIFLVMPRRVTEALRYNASWIALRVAAGAPHSPVLRVRVLTLVFFFLLTTRYSLLTASFRLTKLPYSRQLFLSIALILSQFE
jgi:hypothetical protein